MLLVLRPAESAPKANLLLVWPVEMDFTWMDLPANHALRIVLNVLQILVQNAKRVIS